MSARNFISAFAKTATAVAGFCIAQTHSSPEASSVVLPALGASLGGAYAHQFLNEFFSKAKIFSLLKKEHPDSLNHDLDRLVKQAAIKATSYIKVLSEDLIQEKEQAHPGFYGEGPLKRINAFFDKNLEEIRVFVDQQSVSGLEFISPKLMEEIGDLLFDDIGVSNNEQVWADVKKLFVEKIPFCYDLAIKETLKSDERGLKAFLIVMLMDVQQQVSANSKLSQQILSQQQVMVSELAALRDEAGQSALVQNILGSLEVQVSEMKAVFEQLKHSLIHHIDSRLERHFAELVNISAGLELMIEQVSRSDNPQPRLERYEHASGSEMVFRSRSTSLEGRQKEMEKLYAFCEESAGFQWWLMIGEAGAGKSRLALDFCLGLNCMEWNAGFVDERVMLDFDWAGWKPDNHTFIVVDYVGRYADEVGQMIRALSLNDRAMQKKVRVLLLERFVDQHWFAHLQSGTYQGTVKAMYDSELELSRPDDRALEKIIASVLNDVPNIPPPTVILEHVESIDHQKRPLFAIMVALEYRNSQTGSSLDRKHLLENYLNREYVQTWKPLIGDNQSREKHQMLVCLLTMVGGMEVAELIAFLGDGLSSAFPASSTLDIQLLQTLELYDQKKDFLSPIEPDIIGEYFVLRILSSGNSLQRSILAPKIKYMAAAAWKINPRRAADFIIRAVGDFPLMDVGSLVPSDAISDQSEGFLDAWCSLKASLLGMRCRSRKSPVTPDDVEKHYLELLEHTGEGSGTLLRHRVTAIRSITESLTLNGYAAEGRNYYSQLWKIFDHDTSEDYLLDAGYICLRLVKHGLATDDLELAEHYLAELEWLVKIDPSIASEELYDKSYELIEHAKKIKHVYDRAAELLSADPNEKTILSDIDVYIDAFYTQMTGANHVGNRSSARACFDQLEKYYTFSENPKSSSLFAYALKQMYLTRSQKAADGEFFLEKFTAYLNQYQEPKILEIWLLMWREEVEKSAALEFSRAKDICEQASRIFAHSYAGQNEWQIYWTVLTDIFEKFYACYQIEQAVVFYERLQGMLEMEGYRSNYIELSNCGIKLYLYFNAMGDLEAAEAYKNTARRAAEFAGANFDRNLFMVSTLSSVETEMKRERRKN